MCGECSGDIVFGCSVVLLVIVWWCSGCSFIKILEIRRLVLGVLDKLVAFCVRFSVVRLVRVWLCARVFFSEF